MSDNEKEIKKHNCTGSLPSSGYGSAVENCIEDDDGKLWVDNGEYGSQVNYCPYCGYKSKKQLVQNKYKKIVKIKNNAEDYEVNIDEWK